MTLETYLASHPKKALIFDFDHTLFALDLPWDEYMTGINRIIGEFDPELGLKHTQSPSFEHNLLDIAIEKHGEPLRRKLNAYAAQFEREKLKGVRENRELTDFIRQNHSQYAIFLWSSNMSATIKPILEKTGLAAYFKDLITRDRVEYLKPSPNGFSLIEPQLTYEKSEYLMIGDSNADKIAAESAGIEFFKVKYFEV